MRRRRIHHALVQHVTKLGGRPAHQVHYSAGFDFDERIRAVLPRLPESAWIPALDADGAARPDAQVAELTGAADSRGSGGRPSPSSGRRPATPS